MISKMSSFIFVLLMCLMCLWVGSPLPASPAKAPVLSNSFHASFSEDRTWIVIRTNFSEPTNVSFDVSQRSSFNNSDINFMMTAIDQNGMVIGGGGGYGSAGTSPNFYIQTKFGRFNYSYYHNKPQQPSWGDSSSSNFMPGCLGSYDFTVVSYGYECSLELWINVSSNTSFSTTHGTEVFAFERHDFIGNINIGCNHATAMLNGKKQITITNSLLCWYETNWCGTGFERLSYRTPSGDRDWKSYFDLRGKELFTRGSDTFGDALWRGENGTWTFNANMVRYGGAPFFCPNIYLLGADVKLPQ